MFKKIILLTLTCCLSMHAMEKKDSASVAAAASAMNPEVTLAVRQARLAEETAGLLARANKVGNQIWQAEIQLKKNDFEARGAQLVNRLYTDACEQKDDNANKKIQSEIAFANTKRVLGVAVRKGFQATVKYASYGAAAGVLGSLIPAFVKRSPTPIANGAFHGALGMGAASLLIFPYLYGEEEAKKIKDEAKKIIDNNAFRKISSNYFTLNHIAWLLKRDEDSEIDLRDNLKGIQLDGLTKKWLNDRKEQVNVLSIKDSAHKKSDLHATDRNGWNILHHAAFAGDEKLVKELLETKKLDLARKCKAGRLRFTAAELARNAGNIRIANIIDNELNVICKTYDDARASLKHISDGHPQWLVDAWREDELRKLKRK